MIDKVQEETSKSRSGMYPMVPAVINHICLCNYLDVLIFSVNLMKYLNHNFVLLVAFA